MRAALEAELEAGETGLLIGPSCRFLSPGFIRVFNNKTAANHRRFFARSGARVPDPHSQ